VFKVQSDLTALRNILKHLSEVVYWSGRYPVPIKSGEEFQPTADLPVVALGHYLRDWVDPVLDHFQGSHAPPSDFAESMRRMKALVESEINTSDA